MVFQNNHYPPRVSQLYHEGATAAQSSRVLPRFSQGIIDPRRLQPSGVVYPSCEGFASLDASYNKDDNNIFPYFGMMFSVDALDQPLSITTLELDLRRDLAFNDHEEAARVTVYMHRGEYASVVHSPAAWTVAANATAQPLIDVVTGAVTSHVVPVPDFSRIRMAPHSRLSLYVTMNGPYLDNTVNPADLWGETNGSPSFNGSTVSTNPTDSRLSPVAQDQHLAVYPGAGFSAPAFPPEGMDASSIARLAGKVHYQVANTCPHYLDNDEDAPAPTHPGNETGSAVTTTAVHYYYMANKGLSESIYSAIQAGINTVLNDALTTHQDLARFRTEYGLNMAVGFVTATPAALSTKEHVQCPLPEWTTCPVVMGTVHLTHSSRLSEEELLYHLYSLTGQINDAIRMYELQDTTILYIGFKDVGANFRLVLQGVPRDQRLTADQTDFVSNVLRAYLNATLPSNCKVLTVTVQDQTPSPDRSGTRGLRRAGPSSARRMMTNGTTSSDTKDGEPVGNWTVVGTIFGLEQSFATGSEYLQDVKDSFTKGQERLLQFLQQQLLLPGVMQVEVNGKVPADFFEHMVALKLTGLRLYDAPGSAADDDEPVPDESSASSSNSKGGQRMKLTAVLGVAVAMVVVLFVALLAAKEHFAASEGNKDALQENKHGKHSDTEEDGVGASKSTRAPSSPRLISVDLGGEAPATPGVGTQMQKLPQSATRQVPVRSRSHDAGLIASIGGASSRCAPSRAYSTSHVVNCRQTPGRGYDIQWTPGIPPHQSPLERQNSHQQMGPSLVAPTSAGNRGLPGAQSRCRTYGGGNGTGVTGPANMRVPSNRALPARSRSESLTGVAIRTSTATGARGVPRALSLDLALCTESDERGLAPRPPIRSETRRKADRGFLDPAAMAWGDSQIAGREDIPTVVSFPTEHSGTALVGVQVGDEELVCEDLCPAQWRSNRSEGSRGRALLPEIDRRQTATVDVPTVPLTSELQRRQASAPLEEADRRSEGGRGFSGHGAPLPGSHLERFGSARSRRSDSSRSRQSSSTPPACSAVADVEAAADHVDLTYAGHDDPDFAPSSQSLTRTQVIDAPGPGGTTVAASSAASSGLPPSPPPPPPPPPPLRLHRDDREGWSATAAGTGAGKVWPGLERSTATATGSSPTNL